MPLVGLGDTMRGMEVLIDVIVMAAIFLAVLLVFGIPLWIVAGIERRFGIAKRFLLAAVAITGLMLLAGWAMDRSYQSCEYDAATCGIGYGMGLLGLMVIVVVGYGVAAFVAAWIVSSNKPDATSAESSAERLWCADCVDLVAVGGHDPAHTLRPMRSG